jgi:hypothetical protein
MAKKTKQCGIPASGGPIGYAACDMAWGHEGLMHGNAGDGFYARDYDAEHRRRQQERGVKVSP